jgi:hypothetical protein
MDDPTEWWISDVIFLLWGGVVSRVAGLLGVAVGVGVEW